MNDNSRVQRLIADLGSQETVRQREALIELALIADPAVMPAVVTVLRHSQREIRALAVEVLSVIGDPSALPHLIERLGDRSRVVRQAVIRALMSFESEDITPLLITALLTDEDAHVRTDAIRGLEMLSDTRSLSALIEALDADSAARVRVDAANALGAFLSQRARIALEAAMARDSDLIVRRAAARALAQIGHVDSAPALIRALNTKDNDLWHAAAEALWALDADAMTHVIAGLLDDDAVMRRAALKAVLWLSVEFDDDDVPTANPNEITFGGSWGYWN